MDGTDRSNPIGSQLMFRAFSRTFLTDFSSTLRAFPTDCFDICGCSPWSWTSEQDAAADNQPWPHPPQRLFFNFGLHEMNPENGSTELWPGTHQALAMAGAKGEVAFNAEMLMQRRAVGAPVQVTVPRGGLIVRDVRTWHRGMPNCSSTPRHMLGIGYNAAADPAGEAATRESNNGRRDMVFSDSARGIMEAAWSSTPDHGLERNIVFVPGPVDPWGNQPGELIEERYTQPGREIYRLPTGSIPLGDGKAETARDLLPWVGAVASGLPLARRSATGRGAARL